MNNHLYVVLKKLAPQNCQNNLLRESFFKIKFAGQRCRLRVKLQIDLL
jgi:hypothetical protein